MISSVVGFDIGYSTCFIGVARGGGIDIIDNDFSSRVNPLVDFLFLTYVSRNIPVVSELPYVYILFIQRRLLTYASFTPVTWTVDCYNLHTTYILTSPLHRTCVAYGKCSDGRQIGPTAALKVIYRFISFSTPLLFLSRWDLLFDDEDLFTFPGPYINIKPPLHL